MEMRPFIYPHDMASSGAKELATTLQCRRVHPNKKYVPKDHHIVIDWGTSRVPEFLKKGTPAMFLNNPESVGLATNKSKTFDVLGEAEVSIPEYTKDVKEATWPIVVCRACLQGTKGEGITLVDRGENPDAVLPDAKLYVEYIKKNREYRLHVCRGVVFDFQQKKRQSGFNGNNQIRNHHNGWVYCREGVNPPPAVFEESIKAVTALGLDFGAVDIIFNDYRQKAYVLEVNTAPGLYGSTLEYYANVFTSIIMKGN